MEVGKGYRIPALNEFIQDFEYELKITTGELSGWYNGKKIKTIKSISNWYPKKVWWLPRTREEGIRHDKFDDGTIITWFINPKFDAPPIERYISEKAVRVKIKNGDKE